MMDQKWSSDEIQMRHELEALADDRGPYLDDVQPLWNSCNALQHSTCAITMLRGLGC